MDKPFVLFHDTVYGGQAETRALTHVFGGEKRLKNDRLGLWSHPAARIGDP